MMAQVHCPTFRKVLSYEDEAAKQVNNMSQHLQEKGITTKTYEIFTIDNHNETELYQT